MTLRGLSRSLAIAHAAAAAAGATRCPSQTPQAQQPGANRPAAPHTRRRAALGLVIAVLAGCASGPPVPGWQLDAHASLDRAVSAYLAGDGRVADAEFERARLALSATGRADLLARAALMRCAAQRASLDLTACSAFEPYRADAPPAEAAYADYLAGRLTPQGLALLPAAQQAVAQGLLAPLAAAAPGPGGPATDPALAAITDPVSRLVAAGVLLQAGRASPATINVAVDTASAQGWRRPLLAWLGVQAQRADAAGDAEQAARVRRRISWVQGTSGRLAD